MVDIWKKRQIDRQAHESRLDRRDEIKSRPAKTERDFIWAKACRAYLAENKYCDDCDKRGYLVPAERVAHIKDPKDNPVFFWNVRNWHGLCVNCHSRLIGHVITKVPEPITQDVKLYMVK